MSKTSSPLLPDRYPTRDFFICDVLDAVPKDDMASMEHPIFSLTTKPDSRRRTYAHNGSTIEIVPSEAGLATIHDKDILIYCISQLMAGINDGLKPDKTLYLKAHDLLIATNRMTNGRGYQLLKEALTRLRGTTIVTNIRTNGEEITEGFGLIDSWRTIRQTQSGRMSEIKIELSDWMFNAIVGKEVLTISRDYFRLRKPIERRIYELARKHCGQQAEWSIKARTLQKKCGSTGTHKLFRQMLRTLAQHDHLPDYHVAFTGDIVTFTNRNASSVTLMGSGDQPQLQPSTYEAARKAAPGYDVYHLEQEWLHFWHQSGKPEFKSPDGAYIAFCRKRHEMKPLS
ncbi:MAG: replication initiator protein A [Chloroflexota bacterium]